jgi:hypothetical protein
MKYTNEMVRPAQRLFREMQYVLGPVVDSKWGYITIKIHLIPMTVCDSINRITGEILSPECPNSMEW